MLFTYKLFFGAKEEPASTKLSEEATSNNEAEVSVEENEETEVEAIEDQIESDVTHAELNTDKALDHVNNTENPAGKSVNVENSEDPNVKETIINYSWKPIGTEQVEPHVAVYEKESTDWKEMVDAFEYATALTEQDWILWRIENDGSPQKAKGVVSTKDKKYVYRIFIEWVENEGWKPTKLEQLVEVPAEYSNHSTSTEQSSGDEQS